MGIQNWAENIVLVNLASEPHMSEELQVVIDMACKSDDLNFVIDFADVDIISSSSIAKLLKIRKTLDENNCRLVLSTVNPNTKGVFEITALDSVFEFVDSRFLALAGMQMAVTG